MCFHSVADDRYLLVIETTENLCVICKKEVESGQDAVKITQKGADSINEASHRRGSDVVAVAGIFVHVACRKVFTDKKYVVIKRHQTTPEAMRRKSVRLNEGPGSSATHCLFCETLVAIPVLAENVNFAC